MNKNILSIGIAVIAIIIIAYFVFTAYPSMQKIPATNSGQQTPAASQPSQNQSLPGNQKTVNISNFSFQPTPLDIPVGTTVVWTNNDSVMHQIKSDTFNSQPLSQGDTFSFTFQTAGTYDYSCAIHPSMKGQIVVQ